jgi:hypothetical protein
VYWGTGSVVGVSVGGSVGSELGSVTGSVTWVGVEASGALGWGAAQAHRSRQINKIRLMGRFIYIHPFDQPTNFDTVLHNTIIARCNKKAMGKSWRKIPKKGSFIEKYP